MIPHYRKEKTYSPRICFWFAMASTLFLWWMFFKGLSALGACVLNGGC